MSVDDQSTYLKLPLPHEANRLDEDLPRLRGAFTGLDDYAETTDAALSGLASRAQITAANLTEHLAAENPHHISAADRERAGLVRVGDGIEVADGVISVPPVPPVPSMLYNARDIVASSGHYTVRTTGWHRITLTGGGGGGAGGRTTSAANVTQGGGGGGEGGTGIIFKHLIKGQRLDCVVGAGGSGGKPGDIRTSIMKSGAGEATTITIGSDKYSATGGQGGGNLFKNGTFNYCYGGQGGYVEGDLTSYGDSGGSGVSNNETSSIGGAGGGAGGGLPNLETDPFSALGYGAGGGGGWSTFNGINNVVGHSGADGHAGVIVLEYYDPDAA